MLETVAMSPNQLRASWVVPDPTNGLITNYTIRCNSSNTQPFMTMETSFVIGDLRPFTYYSCNVSATTSAGEGPSSDSRTALTAEDG